MTEEELVHAYKAGQISRRVFIRRLIQGGISVTAALVYADSLASPAAATPSGVHSPYDDEYLHHSPHYPHSPHHHSYPHSPHYPLHHTPL